MMDDEEYLRDAYDPVRDLHKIIAERIRGHTAALVIYDEEIPDASDEDVDQADEDDKARLWSWTK